MIDQPTDSREGDELPIEKLEEYLFKNIDGLQGELSVLQFPGGHSNLTFFLKVGADSFVLRHPPKGIKIKSGHDMGREFKVLSKLGDAFQKIPKTIHFCEEESIIGVPFYLMERVEGIILRKKFPKEIVPNATDIENILEAYLNCFVELHQVNFEAVGLTELGKPDGYITRQVEGWTKRYFNAKTDEVPAFEQLIKWLNNQQVKTQSSAIIHNDYKFDNILFDANDWNKIKAVLDWEMCTIGDPRMDLGTSLAMWVTPEDPLELVKSSFIPLELSGQLSRTAFLEKYMEKSGLVIDNPVFYMANGLFKMGVICQQLYARHKAGKSSDPRLQYFGKLANALATMANQAIDKNRLDDLWS